MILRKTLKFWLINMVSVIGDSSKPIITLLITSLFVYLESIQIVLFQMIKYLHNSFDQEDGILKH